MSKINYDECKLYYVVTVVRQRQHREWSLLNSDVRWNLGVRGMSEHLLYFILTVITKNSLFAI